MLATTMFNLRTAASLTVVLALGLALPACDDKSDDTSSTGDQDMSAGGTTTGTADSGATGSTTTGDPGTTGSGSEGTTGDPAMCEILDTDSPCITCTKLNCCAETQACQADQVCLCGSVCLGEGKAIETCINECPGFSPFAGVFGSLVACTAPTCLAQCEDEATTTGGTGSEGGTGTDTNASTTGSDDGTTGTSGSDDADTAGSTGG